jgi:Tfp pilus assembly protein FimV
MSGDPLLALQLLSESGQELRGLSTLIDRSKLSPEKRLAFLAAWREWSATRPDFPAPPQAAQTVQDPDPFGHPVAKPVPGKEGFVLSPFNNQLIDVRGMRSGSLVSDSSAPPTEKWIFRVP